MNNIRKAMIPAALLLAGLSSVEASAGTLAGSIISNQASMTYNVNQVPQTKLYSNESTLKVDVKVDFSLTATDDTPNNSSIVTVGTTQYYVMGRFNLANSTNAVTQFQLAATETATDFAGFGFADSSLKDTKDTEAGTSFVYYSGAAAPTTLLASAQIELNNDLNATNTQQYIWVLVPTTQVKGKNLDLLGVQLTATAASVTVDGTSVPVVDNKGEDNANDTVQFVLADDAKADGTAQSEAEGGNTSGSKGDAIEFAYDALQLAFPDFTPDPTDPTNSGFTKTAEVVWDPINEANSPKAIPGAIVKYTITIRNLGTVAAEGMEVSDPLPNDTTYCGTADDPTGVTPVTCEDVSSLASDTQQADATYPQYDGTNNVVTSKYASFAYKQDASDTEKVATIVFYVTID